MKKLRLKVNDLRVESFSMPGKGGVVARSESYEMGGCGTHSLAYATHCDCSGGGVNCTLPCIEYSQATDYQICCG